MKILHCCLAAFYIDNYSYQENILPKIHKLQGHDVAILASTESFLENTRIGYLNPSSYHTKDNIPITRIPYINWLPHFLVRKLRLYKGISEVLESYNPDIIFLHDCQFLSIVDIVKFAKHHPDVRIYVDGHTDFINSARNWISKNILHKIIYKWCAKKIEPYVKKFWGVTPLRVDFFIDVYGINKSKVDLLVMGLDDSVVDFTKKEMIRKSVRSNLGLDEADFVIVTGGKIDKRKNIHFLIQAVSDLNFDDIKLIVFGTPSPELKSEIETLSQSNKIKSIGWITPDETYDYFFAADLAIFPGTHSVLWEQAVGIGLPCIFKQWEGIRHIDVGGNCLFLEHGTREEIFNAISSLYKNKALLANMKQIAMSKGISEFAYSQIAKRAIESE